MTEIRKAFAIILVFVILFFWLGLAAATEVDSSSNSDKNSSKEILFDVFLGKKRIGEHSFLFAPSSNGIKVQSRASFDYRLFNISLYNYEHFSEEYYDSENCLEKINSSTLTETKVRGSVKQKIAGERKDNGFLIKGSNDEQLDNNCVMSFAYWNPEILEQASLLNAQTGKEVNIAVRELPVIESGAKYSLEGENLNIEVQYSEEGSWISLKSKVGKGRDLKYVLSSENIISDPLSL